MKSNKIILVLLLAAALLGLGRAASAQPGFDEAVNGLAGQSRSAIIDSLKALADLGDERALAAIRALEERRLLAAPDGRAIIVGTDDTLHYADTGEPFAGERDGLDAPVINNRVRRAIDRAEAVLQLVAKDPAQRLEAARAMAKAPRPEAAELLRAVLGRETVPAVRDALTLALALVDMNSGDQEVRVAAVTKVAGSGNPAFLPLLKELVRVDEAGRPVNGDARSVAAAKAGITAIERHVLLVRSAQNFFYGLSLGSVLLLAALGLAITFGLMGVINMAHGELLMVGAYATYLTQNFFHSHLPGLETWYLAAAVPVAFAAAGATGIAMERSVIRFLYGRPLETLLATWGISLLLIQTVRLLFGAQNVEVANPAWLAGGTEPVAGLLLTYNRVAIIGFVVLTVAFVWYLLNRTSLGLKVRAVTQNRAMAASMGIRTGRVDMWTFGLGSGIAGLGGVALSQIGNVGPELGQGYIVDSFMVVVLGGVGKIAGTIFGAMGLGVVNKLLEPHTGAVLGKIVMLALIILVIQRRPQGLFAPRGRVA